MSGPYNSPYHSHPHTDNNVHHCFQLATTVRQLRNLLDLNHHTVPSPDHTLRTSLSRPRRIIQSTGPHRSRTITKITRARAERPPFTISKPAIRFQLYKSTNSQEEMKVQCYNLKLRPKEINTGFTNVFDYRGILTYRGQSSILPYSYARDGQSRPATEFHTSDPLHTLQQSMTKPRRRFNYRL